MTYFIRQWVSALATPLALAFLVAAVGALLRLRRRARISQWMFGAAALIAYLGALDPVGNALLAPLERKYLPLREDENSMAVSYIVVLGSGYEPRDGIPVTAALDQDGLVRVVEGIRLGRRFTTAMLVMSGGAPAGKAPPAQGYATLARSLGISDSSLIVLPNARTTSEEAQAVATLVGAKTFVLVTSAFHMPRAMRLMERAGVHPIAAPTGQRADRPISALSFWLPSSKGLGKSERALHEYIALLVLAVGGA